MDGQQQSMHFEAQAGGAKKKRAAGGKKRAAAKKPAAKAPRKPAAVGKVIQQGDHGGLFFVSRGKKVYVSTR